jgi:L-threonylcarbamoyladenylate synthase
LTRVLPAGDDPAIDEAAEALRAGGLVAFPTETVYGLGADATDPAAVARIFEAKGRPPTNPLIVHGHSTSSVVRAVSSWPPEARVLAAHFWPGPLTLVLPRSVIIPDVVTAGRDTVGVRVPDHPVARAILHRAGRLVAAPSANRSTGVSPTRAEHVVKDLGGRIDLILDAGPTPVGIESTVLDLSTGRPRLLRPGAIRAGQIGNILGFEVQTPTLLVGEATAASSPGQMDIHYAPRTGLVLLEPDQVPRQPWPDDRRVGLMIIGQRLPSDLGQPAARVDWETPGQAERALYETLHRWDDGSLDLIVAVPPPDEESWRAVRDRLWRASRRWSREGIAGGGTAG